MEPHKAMGSAVPPWKTEVTVPDRWVVIAYVHALSGHAGPHTPSEHPRWGAAMRATEGVKAVGTRVLALMLGAALLLGSEARGASTSTDTMPVSEQP